MNYHQRKTTEVDNVPVKRNWEDFLRLKHIGGEGVNYRNIKVEKTEENFYPSEHLTVF